MSQTIEAIFDGLVFRPLEPVELAPNSRVRLTITDAALSLESLAVLVASGAVNLPESGAEAHRNSEEENLDRYMYENYVRAQLDRE